MSRMKKVKSSNMNIFGTFVFSPVAIITLAEVFDGTVPSKISFSLKSLPQNRWYKSPYSLFS